MPVLAKICGLRTSETVQAAVIGGAAFVGFLFHEKSPRHVTPAQAARLARDLPAGVRKVAVVVDADDAALDDITHEVAPDYIQMHGAEDAARIDAVKRRFGVGVIKAVSVSAAGDLDRARDFANADMLLFDAKAPPGAPPGGNAISFDWTLLAGRSWSQPWFLSGGLTPENVANAVGASGARFVDVSSGVEIRRGEKSAERIAAFLSAVQNLPE
jgi:phosphoribosylanthranilate isomerase